MENSAPKRRRMSPETSVHINLDDATAQASQSQGSRLTNRPSFSPSTKASQSRNNLETLDRKRSRSRSSSPAKRAIPRNVPSAQGENLRLDAARPSSAKPIPRPLPPPAREDEDDINPFKGKVLRRSPLSGVASRPQPEPLPEPELPPSVPDTVSSTPPRGIHSSPSRWREKQKPKKSSPLKQPVLQPPEQLEPMSKDTSRSKLDTSAQVTEVAKPAVPEDTARRTQLYDPNAKQKQRRDELREEIARLKKDLVVAQKENERIRLVHRSGRDIAPSNADEVVELIKRQSISDDGGKEQKTSSQQLVSAILNPARLLPFSKPVSQVQQPASNLEQLQDIKSHHPILMTADEELPYLELFSPFISTTKISMLPQQPDGPPQQLHRITLRSREIEGIFTARIEMTVNANNLAILDLKLAALEPAAKAELGSFAEKICNGDCNRTMKRNVGILSWAMGEWLRVATERAIFWFHLDQQLSTKESLLETTHKLRMRKPRRRKNDEDESDEEEDEDKAEMTRKDMLQYMDRQSLDVRIPDLSGDITSTSTVRLEWKIGFDWTGEAESKVAVMMGLPGKWHIADKRGRLGKLPQLFEELVQGGEEPEVAVKTIVALVVGDQ